MGAICSDELVERYVGASLAFAIGGLTWTTLNAAYNTKNHSCTPTRHFTGRRWGKGKRSGCRGIGSELIEAKNIRHRRIRNITPQRPWNAGRNLSRTNVGMLVRYDGSTSVWTGRGATETRLLGLTVSS